MSVKAGEPAVTVPGLSEVISGGGNVWARQDKASSTKQYNTRMALLSAKVKPNATRLV